jgi:hypothetical protein
MLTIKTTGDDAWDTDRLLLNTLLGYDMIINGKYVRIISDATDGNVIVQPLDIKGTEKGKPYLLPVHNIEIEVL